MVQRHQAGILTKEEAEDFKYHCAEAMKDDVKTAKEEGIEVSKAEVAKMLKQELVYQQPAVTQAQIDKINGQHLSYTAYKSEYTRHMTQKEYHERLGLKINKKETKRMPKRLKKVG